MKKLIILEDSSKATFGGGQKITLKVIQLLEKSYEIILIDCSGYSLFFREVQKKRQTHSLNWLGAIKVSGKSSFTMDWREILSAPYYLLKSVLKIINILKQNNCNVGNTILYATTKKMLIISYLLNLIDGYRYIFHAHALDNNRSKFFSLIKHPMKNADKIICVSEVVAGNIKLPQCQVVYNPIDSEVKSKKNKISEKNIVATFSTLIPLKGIIFFIESFKYLKNSDNIEFWIFGDGPEKKKLEGLTTESIKYKGFSDDVVSEMAENIDIVVVPSICSEACPVVPIEAFSVGIPVICTNIGGQAEIVKHNEVGYHVPVKDAKAIARKIDCLISDIGTYNKFSENAVKYAERNFNKMVFDNKIKRIFS